MIEPSRKATPPGTQVALKVVRPGEGERTVTAALDRLREEPTSEDR